MPMTAIADAAALVACAIAVATDLRARRIPNWLTVAAIGLGFALGVALGPGAFLAAVAGAALGLFVFGVPAAFGLVGMGDVKLVIALGALLRWPLALPLVLYIALAGGAVALSYAVGHLLARTWHTHTHRMPYALALALGCVWAVASRYIDALRLL
jgi:prepilin peptidase CpaA